MVEQQDLAELVARWERERKVDLVCEGGGVLGIGLVGAYSVLEKSGFQPQNLAGTSAGAIVATLIAAGYRAEEVRQIIADLDFTELTDPTTVERRLPLLGRTWVGKGLSLLLEQGLYEGSRFHKIMEDLLRAKGIDTFGDLVYDADPAAEPRYRHKVQVIVSDVTGRRLLRLPLDAKPYLGIEPDRLRVADAVRMSMSIPFFFKAVHWRNPVDRIEHLLVDGGMLSNFPVWLFDSPGPPEWPTIGIRLEQPPQRGPEDLRLVPTEIRGLIPPHVKQTLLFARALIETMTKFHDRLYLDSESFARTIGVQTGDLAGTDFLLTADDKRALYAAGQQAATDFLANKWTFGGYVAAFRSAAPPPHRQALVREAMQEAAASAGIPATPVVPVVPAPPPAAAS